MLTAIHALPTTWQRRLEWSGNFHCFHQINWCFNLVQVFCLGQCWMYSLWPGCIIPSHRIIGQFFHQFSHPFTSLPTIHPCNIQDDHIFVSECYSLLCCDAVYFGKKPSMFRKNFLPLSSGSNVLKIEVAGSSKSLVTAYKTTCCYSPKNVKPLTYS
jgi:hypothetical protein